MLLKAIHFILLFQYHVSVILATHTTGQPEKHTGDNTAEYTPDDLENYLWARISAVIKFTYKVDPSNQQRQQILQMLRDIISYEMATRVLIEDAFFVHLQELAKFYDGKGESYSSPFMTVFGIPTNDPNMDIKSAREAEIITSIALLKEIEESNRPAMDNQQQTRKVVQTLLDNWLIAKTQIGELYMKSVIDIQESIRDGMPKAGHSLKSEAKAREENKGVNPHSEKEKEGEEDC